MKLHHNATPIHTNMTEQMLAVANGVANPTTQVVGLTTHGAVSISRILMRR